MDGTNALSRLTDQPVLDSIAEPLSRAVRDAYELAGPVGQQAKNAMHGVWLRHPLHPVFTDLPIGAWTTGLVLDAIAARTRDRAMEEAGDVAIAVGLAGAAGAAVSGVYDQRVGVMHAAVDGPESFTAVARSADVPDGSMRRVRHDDLDLLIVRQHGRLCALAHSCAHLGGPLSEGTLKDGSVVCPWHGSEFALDDGRVINGPATQSQPCLEVREHAGQIEVKGLE